MGWGRMLLLGNIGQQMDLDDQQQDIDHLRQRLEKNAARLKDADRELVRLADENDELKLYVAALMRVLVAKNVVAPAELRSLIDAIDHEDGTIDGARRGKLDPDVAKPG